MKYGKRLFASIFWVVLGSVLVVCHLAGLIEEFWSSMGIAWIFVGVLQLIKHLRYRTNAAYREQVDIGTTDERNKFIANKAWAWAGWMFVMITAIGTIVFKLMGRDDLMMLCSGSVCLMILLYWGSWMVLKRKY